MSFALVLLFGFVCFGWGRCASRFFYRKTSGTTIAFDAALGLAVLGAIGGLLNLFHVATPVSLYTLVAIGLVFAWPQS